jgi:hypothetical protein
MKHYGLLIRVCKVFIVDKNMLFKEVTIAS